MPRRVKKKSSVFSPIKDNFLKQLSSTNKRLRRRILKIGFWVIGLFMLYSLMSGTYGVPRIIRLELEKKAFIEANQKELVKLIDAERIREMLLNDKDYIEYIARTRYHMVYPGETIYRYQGQ